MSDTEKPQGWTETALSEIVGLVRGRIAPKDEPSLRYVGMDNVEANTMRLLGTVPAASMKSSAIRFLPGDVLYGRLRPYLNKVLAPDFEGLASAEFLPLTPRQGIESKFVQYRINSADFVSFAAELDAGDRPRVDFDEISRFMLLLPPTREQRRMVEAVDSYLSRLDAAVESLTQAQTKLKAYRASVLKAAVEGRLVPTEAELAKAEGRSYEPADKLLERILAERRRAWEERQLADMKAKGKLPKDDKWKAKYEEPAPQRETTPTPTGWVWTNMSSLIVDGPQNGLYLPKDRYGSGNPILRIDDYQVDWSSASTELQQVAISEAEAVRYSLRLGDIVLNRVNSPSHLGKTMVVEERNLPALFESNMMRFRLSGLVLPRYVNAYLCSIDGKTRLTANAKWAVNQASINQGDVGDTQVPLPPLDEQQRIVDEMEVQLAVADSALKQVRDQLTRCARLRQAILKAAFEGRLVDQDPNDEPASELLARLRATPEPAPKTKRGRQPKKTA